ncbi:MAG: ATP-binding cassette domain-containing protein, partial [Methyloligellaceae bacterium]
YMKDFLFAPEQAGTPVGVLSGGERGRLMLARAMARPANLLVLDEPTNDLDIETLDLLQEMLADHAGTVLLVSHDRDFLDRVVTAVIAWDGNGRWVEYAGGYSDMIAQRGGATAAPKVAKPKGGTTGRRAPSPKQGPAARARKRGLSFKDRHTLEQLPAMMEDLQAKVSDLQAALDDPGLYARDPARFETTAAALRQAESELAAAEEQWLALELKREEDEQASETGDS